MSEREQRMEELLRAAYPAREPSEALRRRVAEAADRHRAARPAGPVRRRLPWRMGLGIVAATATVAVAVGLAPTWMAARLLRRADAAMSQVQSMHAVTWRVNADGTRVKVRETWEQDERHRWEDALTGDIGIFADGKLWSYEPKFNRVTVRRCPRLAAYPSSGHNLSAMARDMARIGRRDRIRVLDTTTFAGRKVHRVFIERPGERVRGLLLVDAVTDLPVRGERQRERDGHWRTEEFYELRYNEPLPESLFAPRFPPTVERIDADRMQEEWGRRLSGGIARARVGDRAVVVRDLQVNEEGDVFLLYTAGKKAEDWTGRDWKVELKDDLGTAYVWNAGGFEATIRKQHPTLPNGYVLDGERLEGDWWTPVVPQEPWQQRRFTVSFRVSAVRRHGGPEDPNVPPVYSRRVEFTLPVRHPSSRLLPDWMPFMAVGPQEREVEWIRLHTRARYFRNQNRDLDRSLALYQQALALRDENGEPIYGTQSGTWKEIGEVLRAMGRREEAIAAFEQAIRDEIQPNEYPEGARAQLEVLKAEIAWSMGRSAPGFTATDMEGQVQSLERYHGQVLLIDFWFTRQKKVPEEWPRLKALYRRYRHQGFAVLGVCMNLDWKGCEKETRQLLREQEIPWPQLMDGKGRTGQAARIFGVTRAPYTILVDRKSVVRYAGVQGAALEKTVAELVAETR